MQKWRCVCVGGVGGDSFILTQQCLRVNWAAASFAELFHSDRLIMKHCVMVVRLEECWTDCSPANKEKGGRERRTP